MKKILIVEDDQIVGNIYRNKFAIEGFSVEVVLDGESALAILPVFQPDVVVLDLMLPKLSGMDVLQKIRADGVMKAVPVVILSNTYLSSMVQAAWKAGATKVMSKANCTPRQVLEVIRSLEMAEAAQRAPQRVGNPDSRAASSAPETRSAGFNTTPPIKPGQGAGIESLSHEDLRRSFATALPGRLSALRPILQSVLKTDDKHVRSELLGRMHQEMRALANWAGVAGLQNVGQLCAALEALLKELCEKPQNVNTSTLRTTATALDSIGILLVPGQAEEKRIAGSGNILVVDDEPMSRRALSVALEKASLSSVLVENPRTALELLSGNKFDLVFLDIEMPGMNGLELCAKLRELPAHKKTPVIFVTALNDFDNRASSMMSGGTDLIGKPFLFIELAVKALCYVLRSRMESRSPSSGTLAAIMAGERLD
mgnify:CR=1 FL=1